MAAEEPPAEPTSEAAPSAGPNTRRRLLPRLLFLVFGASLALYLSQRTPREQHVRVVLGPAAPGVTGLDLQYVTAEGDVARETRFVYARGGAPRVVSHDPKLPDGDYRLELEVDARGGRRTLQRRVTLGGGSTQVDVSGALAQEEPADGAATPPRPEDP